MLNFMVYEYLNFQFLFKASLKFGSGSFKT